MNNIKTGNGIFGMAKRDMSRVEIMNYISTGNLEGDNRYVKINGSIWINKYDITEEELDNLMVYIPDTLLTTFYDNKFKLAIDHEEWSKVDSQRYYVCKILMDEEKLYPIDNVVGDLKMYLWYQGDGNSETMRVQSNVTIEEVDNIDIYNGTFENEL